MGEWLVGCVGVVWSLYDILNVGIIITCPALMNVNVVVLIVINDPNMGRQMHVTRQSRTLRLDAMSAKSAGQSLYHHSGPGRGRGNRFSVVPWQMQLSMSWTN